LANYKQEMVAMILAGGQGSRLREITDRIAKPAVPFGGKYRIIDFTLSNCSNSNISAVGVLTQYQPLELNTHIGIGSSWDLDKNSGGVKILQPYFDKDGGKFYRGTANAIYENMNYIDSYDPEGLRLIRDRASMPIASCESLFGRRQFRPFFENRSIDVSIIDVPWNGLAESYKISTMAEDSAPKESRMV